MTHFITPNEAKTKICPMAKGGSSMGKDSLCVAHGCMAWRQSLGRVLSVEDIDTGDTFPYRGVHDHRRERLIREENETGYCGMVGGDQ